jgi:hypothetical protein
MTSFADAIFVCEKRGTHAYTAGETSARGITRQMTLLAAGAVSKVRRLYSDGYEYSLRGAHLFIEPLPDNIGLKLNTLKIRPVDLTLQTQSRPVDQ